MRIATAQPTPESTAAQRGGDSHQGMVRGLPLRCKCEKTPWGDYHVFLIDGAGPGNWLCVGAGKTRHLAIKDARKNMAPNAKLCRPADNAGGAPGKESNEN